jgi:hypothetical protein
VPTLDREPTEVVNPEVLARWRKFVPEGIIEALIRQRTLVMEARRVEEYIRTPQFTYPAPLLPKMEIESKVFAVAIDWDGHIAERRTGADAIGRTERRVV